MEALVCGGVLRQAGGTGSQDRHKAPTFHSPSEWPCLEGGLGPRRCVVWAVWATAQQAGRPSDSLPEAAAAWEPGGLAWCAVRVLTEALKTVSSAARAAPTSTPPRGPVAGFKRSEPRAGDPALVGSVGSDMLASPSGWRADGPWNWDCSHPPSGQQSILSIRSDAFQYTAPHILSSHPSLHPSAQHDQPILPPPHPSSLQPSSHPFPNPPPHPPINPAVFLDS